MHRPPRISDGICERSEKTCVWIQRRPIVRHRSIRQLLSLLPPPLPPPSFSSSLPPSSLEGHPKEISPSHPLTDLTLSTNHLTAAAAASENNHTPFLPPSPIIHNGQIGRSMSVSSAIPSPLCSHQRWLHTRGLAPWTSQPRSKRNECRAKGRQDRRDQPTHVK